MKTDRKHVRDRVAAIGLPILCAVLFVAMVAIAFLTITNHNQGIANGKIAAKAAASSDNHHAQTVKQNATIIQQNKEIEKLLGQHSADLALLQQEQAALSGAEAKLSTAGTYIGQFDAWLAGFQMPLCQLPGLAPTAFCTTPPPVAPATLGAP